MNKEYVFIGKIVNTHGIKGELRILSKFDKKELVFKPDFPIYIGENLIKEFIKDYRHHKEFDQITLKGYENINEVLKYKGLKVYVKRKDLNLLDTDYLLDDLLGMMAYYKQEFIGEVIDILGHEMNILLKIKKDKEFYIPYNQEFILKIDLKNNQLILKNIEGLIL